MNFLLTEKHIRREGEKDPSRQILCKVSLTYQNFLIPVINKPMMITKTNATLIDHILLTNDFVNTDGRSTGIVKRDVSDLFPVFSATSAQYFNNIQNKTTIRKAGINEKFKHKLIKVLNEVNWKHLYSNRYSSIL